MILTYRIKHGGDFSEELLKARQVAEFALRNRHCRSSKDVKHFGLKSAIANQILRKYGRNLRCKRINRVHLIVPGQQVQCNQETRTIRIPCLGVEVTYQFEQPFLSINQIEADSQYLYVSVRVANPPVQPTNHTLGVDLNATGHIAVVAIPHVGKVEKLGRKAYHTQRKYRNLRQRYQRNGCLRKLQQVKDRERRIVRDLNHQVSRKIVTLAKEHQCSIRMEHLEGIRQRASTAKSFRYTLNSGSFHQLRMFVEYKAKLLGVEVATVDPAYTSKSCSRCGLLGDRDGKRFQCPHCGHVDHADVNAAFNIGQRRPIGRDQIAEVRDSAIGSTDTPRGATAWKAADSRTPRL